MTYEEAKLKMIQSLPDDFFKENTNREALSLMGIALEKQIPKKPKKIEENLYSIFYDCPCCGGYLVSKIDGELCGGQKYKYCYRCGQALGWSDTE